MDTVLDVGLTDTSVPGLAAATGSERFAWDSYRRLIQMFGTTVMGVEAGAFERALEDAQREAGTETDVGLGADGLKALVATFKDLVRHRSGREFPQDPAEQLDLAVRAVFDSWNTERARVYRRRERIPQDLGTAVNVMSMVFGNLGQDSGTGVAFTRDPGTGAQGVWGDYLPNAQGEDVVAGIRNPVPLADLEAIDPVSYRDLLRAMDTLEGHYRDLCDIEFTIERGRLWLLQTRVGKRTAAAAFRLAVEFLDQGLIDEAEALRRVTGDQLAQLMFPQFAHRSRPEPIASGVPASPGAAVGEAVFDSEAAAEHSGPVILVRRETNPDDLPGMIAAAGILTSRGGKTSHAAVVARGMGKTCVVGTEGLAVDYEGRRFTAPGGIEVREGDVISIDGTTGAVYWSRRGRRLPVVDYFEGRLDPDDSGAVVTAVARLMDLADRHRGMGVHANADTPEDAERARRFGAAGIGLCRTEHMFLGERRRFVEDLILAESPAERDKALAELLPLQLEDFEAILAAMDGLPVTIRLIDPPLHEFLPDLTDLSVRVALAEERGEVDEDRRGCWRRCGGSTSRTRCWACAGCAWAWWCRAWSRCRCGRSPRPRPPGSGPGATRVRR
ncbi:hypothetical protein GCM10029992_46400 [Glycomyces albus]